MGFFSKASKAGGTASTDFQTNDGTPTPVDIAGPMQLPVRVPLTGIEATPNGIMVYSGSTTGRILGQNPSGLGVGDDFRYESINNTVGCLSPHLLGKMSDNEQIVVSNNGVFQMTLSENFQEVIPGGLSYDIQPEFDAIGRYCMSQGQLLIAPHTGIALLATPRRSSHIWLDKLWVYHFGVGVKAGLDRFGNAKEFPWMANEFFGGTPTSIKGMIVDPSDNSIYIAIGDTIYKWSGTSFLDSGSIRSEYQFPPNAFGASGLNKYIKAYWILYKSSSGATFRLDHAWDNGDGGSTEITVPAKTVAEVGTSAILGTSPVTFKSAFSDSAQRYAIAGGQIGKNLIVSFLHDSATEDLTIYDIQIEYELMGTGA